MGKVENAVIWAISIANDNSHGYDQGSRNGPNYDCSSLISWAYSNAGLNTRPGYTPSTSTMYSVFKSAGFHDVTGQVNKNTGSGMKRGDVLLKPGNHTAMYIGNGQLVEASQNEFGGITGGKSGDQTGKEIWIHNYYNFPWTYVLRCEEESEVKYPMRNLCPGNAFIDRDCKLYSQPTTNSSVVINAKKDDNITILDYGSEWVTVRYNSTICYAQCDYVLPEFYPGETAETVINADVTLPKGTVVTVKDTGHRGNNIAVTVYIPSTNLQKKE